MAIPHFDKSHMLLLFSLLCFVTGCATRYDYISTTPALRWKSTAQKEALTSHPEIVWWPGNIEYRLIHDGHRIDLTRDRHGNVSDMKVYGPEGDDEYRLARFVRVEPGKYTVKMRYYSTSRSMANPYATKARWFVSTSSSPWTEIEIEAHPGKSYYITTTFFHSWQSDSRTFRTSFTPRVLTFEKREHEDGPASPTTNALPREITLGSP